MQKSTKKAYTKMIGIYIEPSMYRNLRLLAANEGITVSDYVRQLIAQDPAYQTQKESQN